MREVVLHQQVGHSRVPGLLVRVREAALPVPDGPAHDRHAVGLELEQRGREVLFGLRSLKQELSLSVVVEHDCVHLGDAVVLHIDRVLVRVGAAVLHMRALIRVERDQRLGLILSAVDAGPEQADDLKV